MKKLLVVDKKLNSIEKKKILNEIYKRDILVLDFSFYQNKHFYFENNFSKKIIEKNIYKKKNFLNICNFYSKKIEIFLKKNPNYVNFKFTEFNLSDFWWKLIFKVELVSIYIGKNRFRKVEVIESYKSNLSSALTSQININHSNKKKFLFNQIFYKFYLKKNFLI